MINSKSKYYQIPNRSKIPNPKLEIKMNGKTYNLRERTFEFAQKIIEISELLPKRIPCEVICNQLIKAGTSVGANVEEADGTITKKDFISKMVIARKEAKETSYWLRLIMNKYMTENQVIAVLKECHELINILSSIVNKSR